MDRIAMVCRKKIENEKEWLNNRSLGIGASESGAILGISPWMSNLELWELKTGGAESKDLSDNESVQRGKKLEPVIRDLFASQYPEFEIEHHPYDLLYQEERPWLFATLDGELTDKETGQRGVLEIKTSSPPNRAAWDKWKTGVPDVYVAQLTHQLAATGFDFAVLYAALFKANGEILIKQPYLIRREEVKGDIEYLIEEETKFWQSVVKKERPGLKLTL